MVTVARTPLQVLSLPPEASVYALFEDANNIRLTVDNAVLSIDELNERVARARVATLPNAPQPVRSLYMGSTHINWDRLSLDTFFEGIHLPLVLDVPCTTFELIEAVYDQYGLRFDPRDIASARITEANSRPFTLRARADSLRWYGGVDFYIGSASGLAVEILPGSYIGNLGRPPQATRWVDMYGSHLNGNLHAPFWKTVAVNTLITGLDAQLVNALVDTLVDYESLLTWSCEGGVRRAKNLYGAKIISNGVVPDYIPAHHDPSRDQAIRVLLDTDYCLLPEGIVTIYYRADFVPGHEPASA